MKLLLHLCILCLLLSGGTSFAQTTEEKAQSAFLTANDAHEKGNFTEAVNYLKQARDLLGKTNTKIQYLLVKTLMATKDYPAADVELKSYFAVTPETARDARYDEMVKSVASVEKLRRERGIELVQIRVDSLANAERAFKNRQVQIKNIKQEISQNKGRIVGKGIKGVIGFLGGTMLTTYGLVSDWTEDSNGIVALCSGIPIFLLTVFGTMPNVSRLRSENGVLQQELDTLESQSTKKQITFSPFYSPHQQAAGLAVRMRF